MPGRVARASRRKTLNLQPVPPKRSWNAKCWRRCMLTPRRIYGLTICVFACVMLNLPAAAQTPGRRVGAKSVERAQRRFALVIGNSSYKDAPLVNPVNDANDMAVTLAEFGLEVIKGLNVDQRQMKQLIRQFGQKMQKGGVGLFYFLDTAFRSTASITSCLWALSSPKTPRSNTNRSMLDLSWPRWRLPPI